MASACAPLVPDPSERRSIPDTAVHADSTRSDPGRRHEEPLRVGRDNGLLRFRKGLIQSSKGPMWDSPLHIANILPRTWKVGSPRKLSPWLPEARGKFFETVLADREHSACTDP